MCEKGDKCDGVCPPSELGFKKKKERRCVASNWKLLTKPPQYQCIRCRQRWREGTKPPVCLLQLDDDEEECEEIKKEEEKEVEESELDRLVGRFEKHGDGSYSYI